MRLAILLTFLACLGATKAYNEDFERAWEEDVAFNEQYLLQNKHDAENPKTFHDFPRVEKRRVKRSGYGNNCPPGYTGLYCESPICRRKEPISTHEIRNSIIEKTVVESCSDFVSIYVDSRMSYTRITVQTSGESGASGQLYDNDGNKIMADTDQTVRKKVHVYNYYNLTQLHQPGVYTFSTTSANDENCLLTVQSATPLVVYGGFVESQFDDKVQKGTPTGESVQRNPMKNHPSYFAFMTTNSTANDAPKFVSFHREENSKQQFAPLPVAPRYNCNADQFVGPYTCLDTGSYFLKVRGMDNSGSVWQRVYHFACDPDEDEPPPITPSTGPILECQNGGTLVKQKQQNVCYCGEHFTGPTCETKLCDHGGYLNIGNQCICPDGYGGKFCEHIQCREREKNLNKETRALTFVVRAHSNFNVYSQVQHAAKEITDYFEDIKPGFFTEFALVLVINGKIVDVSRHPRADEFLQQIDDTSHLWENSTLCQDNIYAALDAALDLPTTIEYIKSPIIIFTDATSNDDDSTKADLGLRLSAYKSPVFTVFYGGDTDNCNVGERDPGYYSLQVLAQYTTGITVRASVDGTSISEVAIQLAMGFLSSNLLGGYDLIFSCQYAPENHLFFVDESVEEVIVVSVGPDAFKLRVIDTNENKLNPDASGTLGNLKYARYPTLTKGHYRLSIDHGGQTDTCMYRIYATTKYEAFFGGTLAVDIDLAYYQPLYQRDVHLVGTISNVDFPDPENINAEIIIWNEDRTKIDGKPDNRQVLYASNGIYRDGCSYNLYFGLWKCEIENDLFYVNMYVTDSSGFTVLRTTTGQCAHSTGLPEQGCRNGGVEYKGQCLCTAGWSGKVCQTADCYNGGTPNGDHCLCLVSYGGAHCQLNRCTTKNEDVQFDKKGITVALAVQKSYELVSPLLAMQKIAPKVVQNLQSTHKQWIKLYTFWDFDQNTFHNRGRSPFAEDIITEIGSFIKSNRASPYMCDNLKAIDALIAILSSEDATNNMEIFFYLNGGVDRHLGKQKELYRLIDTLQARIHVVQDNNINCYPDLDDPAVTIMASIAIYSGGTYSLSGDGRSLLKLPLQFNTANVYDELRQNCTGNQTFYFPIASETQTISMTILGEIKGDVVFTTPNGISHKPIQVYNTLLDSLYVAMKGCQDGWDQLEDHCYRMEPSSSEVSQKTFEDARSACFHAGGTLATILDSTVDSYLKSHSTGGFDAWIGLNDIEKKGDWKWDEGVHQPIPWKSGSSYNGFKTGEPNVNNGRCVALSTSGWYVTDCNKTLSYICSLPAYTLDYDPGSANEEHIRRGLWSVRYETFGQDELVCGLLVHVQSSLQVTRQFVSNAFTDEGEGQAILNYDRNYQIVHVESSADSFMERSTLEYAHYYPTNSPDMAFVSRLSPRQHCSYEYISDAFNPKQAAYVVAYTGFDAYGYPYQRIIPAIAADNKVSCENGGVMATSENICVCPPGYTGKECTQPVCANGILADNKVKCHCLDGFVGDYCQHPNCTASDSPDPPPIPNTGRTLALVIDGSYTGYNEGFLTNFKKILDKTLDTLTTDIEKKWFTNYAAIIAFDTDHGVQTSQVVVKNTRADFETAIMAEFDTKYKSKTRVRRFMRSLQKLLTDDGVYPGSPVYILTDSGIADPASFSEKLYNLIALKHVTISTIIFGDYAVPGGKDDYRDMAVEPYILLAFSTGGGFYQVNTSETLAGFWSKQLATYFSSYGVAHSFHRKCSDVQEYFQVGGEDNNVIIDIFSPNPQTIFMYDPDDKKVSTGQVQGTNTNYIFSTTATKPGIWKIVVNHTDRKGFCVVAIRSTRSDAPSVAFNNDVGIDRGYHSQESTYAPNVDAKNSIIAYTPNDYLSYVHVYTHDTGSLVFTSPMVRRTPDCKWNYVSKYLFECPASSFTVAVEGFDRIGHQFRRLYKTHCINFDRPPVGSAENVEHKHHLSGLLGPIESTI